MLMNIYNRFVVTTIQTICTHNLITRFTKNKLQKKQKKKQQRRSEQFNLKLQLLINVTKTNVQNPSYNNMINDNNGMWYQSL